MRQIFVLAVLMALAGTPVAAQVFGSTGPTTAPTTAQQANYIYAGPVSGAAATPAFRALVSADIPNNAASTTGDAAGITGKTFLGTGTKIAQFTAATVPNGNRCVQTDATGALAETAAPCGAGAGTGTVTSVAVTLPLSGGPITTTGNLSCPTCVTAASALTQYGVMIGGGLQASSTIAASVNTTYALFATATAPAFRAIVAGDVPTLNQSTTGNAATATALAANGANCSAGNYPLGVNASGAVEDCTAVGAGGGASAANDLTDFKITISTTSVTNDTINIAAGHARVGNYSPTTIALGKLVVTAGSGDVKVFIDANNNLVCHKATAGSIAVTESGSVTCSNVTTPAYPANGIPLYDLTVSAAQAVTIDADDRAFLSNRGVSAGTGISISDAGGVASIGIDTATVPQLGAGQNDFTGIGSFLEVKLLNSVEGTCDASNRGRVVMVQGGAGVADTFRVCRKDASNNYAFATLL